MIIGVGKPDDRQCCKMLVHDDAEGLEHRLNAARWVGSVSTSVPSRSKSSPAGGEEGIQCPWGLRRPERPVVGSGDHESRFGREQRKKPAHRGRRNCDAALRRREARARNMEENCAAATLDGRPAVPIELDHAIVKRVIPPEAFMAAGERERDTPVIARVARVVAPALIRPDRPGWQKRCVRMAIFGAKHKLNGPQGACGRPAVAFALGPDHACPTQRAANGEAARDQPAAPSVEDGRPHEDG